MEYTKGENIEHQILEAIKEVLRFKDPDTIKASIILNRLRTILGLKDLATAPDCYEALKLVKLDIEVYGEVSITTEGIIEQAIAKAEVVTNETS